jgi:hypothetical protein
MTHPARYRRHALNSTWGNSQAHGLCEFVTDYEQRAESLTKRYVESSYGVISALEDRRVNRTVKEWSAHE